MTSQITSKAIDYLRFPLILGVVFGHCHIPAEGHPLAECVEFLISDGVVRMTVPLFFVVSGYLFFHKVSVFSRHVYAEKIRSRFHSILVPYLIWNFIAFALILRKSFFEGTLALPTVLDTALECFIVGTRSHGFPEIMLPWSAPGNFPLWFIRDIFVFALVSPLFYIVLKRCGAFVVGFLAVCFLAGWWINGTVFSIPGILYFSVGAYFGIKKLNPSEILVAHRGRANILLAGWLCLIVADVATFGTSYHYYIHSSQIFIGVLAAYWCATVFAERCKSDSLMDKIPGGAVFCVFVMHAIILSDTSRLLLRMLGNSEVGFIFAYFANIVLSTVCPLIFYFVMNRFAPSILAFLLGGRSVPVAFKRR